MSETRRGGGSMAPFAAAAAIVVLLVAAVVLWPRHHQAAAGSMTCPASFDAGRSAVPAKPQTSNPGSALVPGNLPDKAVLCGYVHGTKAATKILHGDPRAIVVALRKVKRSPTERVACQTYSVTSDGDNYLLALSYAGRVIWVQMPGNHCTGTSNGVFDGATNQRADAAQAFTHGVWPTDPTLTKSCDVSPADNGPAVIKTVTSATICLDRDGVTHVLSLQLDRGDHDRQLQPLCAAVHRTRHAAYPLPGRDGRAGRGAPRSPRWHDLRAQGHANLPHRARRGRPDRQRREQRVRLVHHVPSSTAGSRSDRGDRRP